MLTKDDVEQIGKVIDARLDVKLEPLKKAIGRVEQKLDREVTDLAKNTHEIMIKLNKLDDHERRIEQLEEHVGLSHPQ